LRLFAFHTGLDRARWLWYALGNHKGDDGNEYALPGGQRAWVGVSQVRAQGGKSFLSCRLNADASKPGRSGPRYHDLAMLVATERLAPLGEEEGWYRASVAPVPLIEGRELLLLRSRLCAG